MSALRVLARPTWTARAPGRLDVMGGIADYSGATVLQLPLAESVKVSVQRTAEEAPDIATRRGGKWQHWNGRRDDHWALYVTGVLDWCRRQAHEEGLDVSGAVRVRISSDVPEGMGVASSAALELATMAAACAAYRVEIPLEAMARASQWVENRIVGAPCGIMDQMTSACGRKDQLLRLACRPATIEGYVAVPPAYRFFGITSGQRHAVTGADYTTVRTAAFMGYRIIAELAGLRIRRGERGVVVEDPRWQGYLANITPEEYRGFARELPETMNGRDFLTHYTGTTDAVTRVVPNVTYPVRAATEHPIREQQRIVTFAELLPRLAGEPALSRPLGELMLGSHEGYRACGLSSDGPDRLVELCMQAGVDAGIYGARITGGGSGGTVAVFATSDAERLIRDLARRYHAETGREAVVFAQSGPGVRVDEPRLA